MAVNTGAVLRTPIVSTPAPTTSAACCCPACAGLTCLDRTRFFAGQLLTEGDLNQEQSYLLAKNRLHNRFLHGWGVVCGMQVVCAECDGWVTIKTGYAIDPCGNDIIVCQDYPFNVFQAIQACCKPAPTTNCSPLRYTPPSPTCQDAIQTWCITIQYQEQQSRMVTPLQQVAGNGGNGNCGTRGLSSMSGTSKTPTSCGCSSSASQTTATVPTGTCEPTRIMEGFQVGVVCEAPTASPQEGPAPGTMGYQILQCLEGLKNLISQNPLLSGYQGSDQQAYQATCNYLATVQNALSSSFVTHCQLESALAGIGIPTPPQRAPLRDTNYITQLQQQVIRPIIENLVAAILDCLCTSFLPPCPPDPCDKRLILACVTVQNGKIVNICHFGGGRKQVVTFPSLYYWLSLIGLDTVLGDLSSLLGQLCCGEEKLRERLLDTQYATRENLSSAGLSNPSMINRYMTSFIAQKLGAVPINSAAGTAQTVDLRPLVGKNLESVSGTLASWGIAPQRFKLADVVKNADLNNANPNITVKDVSADPAWTAAAVAASAQYAPAAFNVTQPLTIFTKGGSVVGFDVTDPVAVLQQQVATLTAQVNKLQPAPVPAPSAGTGTSTGNTIT